VRRLTCMLAAGLLAAGTVLPAAGAASAASAIARRATCPAGSTEVADVPLFVQPGSVRYFVGTPNRLASGAAAFLKPSENSTTKWVFCQFSGASDVVINRGLYLTSRSTSPGWNVTVETPGYGGTGFSSQHWNVAVGEGVLVATNVKTGLSLRVRNSGPIMGQSLTTGSAATAWSDNSGGTWGTAMEVPGTATLNAGGNAIVTSVSCGSAANCSAGGWYFDNSRHAQAFVVSQVGGIWGTAKEVPGTAALNQGFAFLTSVSCASAGNCSAGGQYNDSSGSQAFVVSQVNGTWRKAKEVPGTTALNTGRTAAITSVSCASAGNCGAGGSYLDSSGHAQAFVVSQVNGTWGTAREVPGTATLNTGNDAINSMSCGSADNCGAGGYYRDSSGNRQAFVVNEVNGTWRKAKEVAAALNQPAGRAGALVHSVSCTSAGNCSAGGSYTDNSGHSQAFVVNEVNGTWDKAEEVPGTAALNQGLQALVLSVSCASAGNCSAGGQYTDIHGHSQVFVVNEVNGTWGTAEEVPGTATLNHLTADLSSVSCASAGSCSAGGDYTDSSGHSQAFVVSQVGGTWGTAKEVPGTATLNAGVSATLNSVSCASASSCSAGGWYTDSSGHSQAFVVSQS
jgi:hypothetical protein